MEPTFPFSTVIPFAIGIALLVLGAVLIKRGLWPRRRGDEPHCRSCGYLLIGIQSERCPECGGLLSAPNVVRGQGRRHRGIACIGAGIALIGVAMLMKANGAGIDDIPWYHFKPTFLVIRDLNSGTALDAAAMQELDRREKAGGLSLSSERQIVELALAQQTTAVTGSVTEELIQFLEQQYLAGHMTDAQKARFGQQSFVLRLRVRPIVALGDQVPFQVDESSRVCGNDFFIHTEAYRGDTEIEGKNIRLTISSGTSITGLCPAGSGSDGGCVECGMIGEHQLLITFHFELRHGNRDSSTLLYQEDRTLAADFEVVAKPPAGNFSLINDPKLGDLIKASMVPEDFYLHADEPRILEGTMRVTGAPANVAFDVFARFHDRECKLGRVVFNKGSSSSCHVNEEIKGIVRGTEPSKIDLIFRSNEKMGRETVDQHDIWNGELIYRDVPVFVGKSQ